MKSWDLSILSFNARKWTVLGLFGEFPHNYLKFPKYLFRDVTKMANHITGISKMIFPQIPVKFPYSL